MGTLKHLEISKKPRDNSKTYYKGSLLAVKHEGVSESLGIITGGNSMTCYRGTLLAKKSCQKS